MGRGQAGQGGRVSLSRTTATTPRADDGPAARRDLAIAAVTGVGLSRLLDGDAVWLVAGLVLGAMLLGALQVLAEDDPAAETGGVPIESLILPASQPSAASARSASCRSGSGSRRRFSRPASSWSAA